MAKVISYDEAVYKKFTCSNCGDIVQYTPFEDKFIGKRDEGIEIKGLHCPGCRSFHRTNH
jgi:transcription initiation factor IIE alpha subunit